MAITITPKIEGQVANDLYSYCYLYEPLEVEISVTGGAKKVYIDLATDLTVDLETPDNFIPEYADFDLNQNTEKITVDLMRLARQYSNTNVYKFSKTDDLAYDFGNNIGWESFFANLSPDGFYFKIYTEDENDTPVEIRKLPIVGGRGFREFVPNVTHNTVTNEFELYGLDLSNRWKGYPVVSVNLQEILNNSQGASPIITVDNQTQGTAPCGGFLIWKSKYGGWCYWGFDLKTEKKKFRHVGKIEVGMFESSRSILGGAGDPFIEPNYTSIETSYTTTLKALSLSTDELKAVSGINESPAVYYVEESGRMELMKLNSANAPIDSKANGGDFSVSLSSITTSSQKTR